ncbi:bifunctional NAD(P)H-dependent oxidoreductase/GNAT family N-acetyltransferase [Saxibacter everestensis]|uniref:Bifunctional NAD(P)H-dependent oxidoreductase/GNAT family N-acetyltransferase n=1 Tax=Saxibacter everestensis TaxID=2909229 RepID=A0ABY8QTE5_9MICO|nr:bifunctional NAD(P)H-dependent oxidoreductase/GNAT family N-acetyltransferase [Brevibacteriaceae bacterium ZFBP1038]
MSTKLVNHPIRLLVIVASTRPGRLGPAVADWFIQATQVDAEQAGITVEIADLAEVALPFLDEPEHPSTGVYTKEHTRAWSGLVDRADAFVVITPEYNYGMPAVLKNALDYLYREWAWKPVAFVSYGNTSAGTRSVQMAKQVVTTLRMMPIGATVALRIADSIQDGLVQKGTSLDQAARNVLEELSSVARALRPLRATQKGGSPNSDTQDGDTEDSDSPNSVTPNQDGVTPGPVDGLALSVAGEHDLAELLVLQRCCWVQEALANNTLDLWPLRETLTDIKMWVTTWRVWIVRRQGRLVAAVRARTQDSTWEIGRLMVAPDQAGNGIGSWLLAHSERHAPDGTSTIALFTGQHSHRNIGLYRRSGYAIYPAPMGTAVDAVYLTKAV